MAGIDKCKDVVYSSRVRFARNIVGLPFPEKLTGEEEIYSVLMRGVEQALSGIDTFHMYRMNGMDPLDAQALVEKHLISPALVTSRYGAVMISRLQDISVMINEEDHIRAQCLVRGFDLNSAFKKLVEADKAMARKLNFAFDNKYGYLTACPTNMGAGMRASFMVFVPALTLTGALNSVLGTLPQFGVTARGVYGEGSQQKGFMYQISNQAMIGAGEEEILSRVTKVAESFIRAERAAREDLARRGGVDLQDKIMRAYGILCNACKVATDEFMELIAYVKLGIAQGLINADADKADELITLTQPAMLCKAAGKKLNAEERDITRARIVKNALAR